MEEFRVILEQMAGTKESIRKAKEWVFERPSEIGPLAETLRDHVVRQSQKESASPEERFKCVLYAIYLLNDVFFNSTKEEPFRDGCLPELPAVVKAARRAAPNDASRDKVTRVVDLWGSKQVFADSDIAFLRAHCLSNDDDGGDSRLSQQKPLSSSLSQKPLVSSSQKPDVAKLQQAAMEAAKQLQHHPGVPMGVMPTSTSLPAVGFASCASAPRCDLAAIPVGIMAGLVRVALNNGHEPWTPLDVAAMPALMPPAVEPGRLEARLSEFYRVLEKNRLKRAASKISANDDHHPGEVTTHAGGVVEEPLNRRPRLDLVLPAMPPNRQWPSLAPRPFSAAAPNLQQPPAEDNNTEQRPIGDDNLGKQMLRGMGWQEGKGLGVAGRGRAEPVNDAGQTDKIGIGNRPSEDNATTLMADDAFAQFRAHRSSGYKARWQ